MSDDPTMAEIMAAVALLHGGDRHGARNRLEAVWSRIANDPEPIHECVLSHYLADTQDDIHDELGWDIRALNAALRCTDAESHGNRQALPIASFLPSLHANLAEDYFKLGELERSKEHLAYARSHISNLADDPYGRMVRGGVERLAKRLQAHEQTDGAV